MSVNLSIRTNVASLNAQRNLSGTQGMLNNSLARLSSGYRITSAGDDAAGLGISENLRAQIRGFQQASRNASDGISLLQTAEGGMNEIGNILIRMRELAVQSASDGIGATERGYLDTEFQALDAEIDRIASTTEFNGQKLIDGSLGTTGLDFQVGIRNTSADQITLTVGGVTSNDLGVDTLQVDSKANALTALDSVDSAINTLSGRRASLGALGNRLNSTINNLGIAIENLSAANSRIRDVNVAEETASFSRGQILMQAGISMLAQANVMPQVALSLLG